MSFNQNQICEGYGTARLEWGDYPWMHDPHRCGTAPFSPQVMSDGSQNSCASYCSGFDEKGCNKYRPNYPDDYYLLNYLSNGGNCDDFNDCKREITPITGGGCPSHTNVIENFGMFPQSPLGIVMWLVFLYLIAKIIFSKK